MHDPPSEAPGSLEQVRTLLNSWRIPHDTREPTDDLPGWFADPAEWAARLPDVPRPAPDEVDALLALRDDLRAELGEAAPEGLNVWLAAHAVVVRVDPDGAVGHVGDGAVGDLLALVTAAVAAGWWSRLKACPDCRHVFYDHSRNRSRTWCGMYAGSVNGRACGSIAKVRRYRSRQGSSTT